MNTCVCGPLNAIDYAWFRKPPGPTFSTEPNQGPLPGQGHVTMEMYIPCCCLCVWQCPGFLTGPCSN